MTSPITSWVYLFSRFTHEALLFELLGIFILTATYSAFWILRKRKIGVITDSMPAGMVKEYLGELLTNMQGVKGQLFGDSPLPTKGSYTPSPSTAPTVALTGLSDSAVLQKLAQLESQMAEKEKSHQQLLKEKEKIEKELSLAKSASAKNTDGDASGAESAEIATLKEKIQSLEDRLAEYSVIEDDLANLKRLQQENTQLKNQLATQGVTPTTIVATTAANPTASASSFDALVNDVEKKLEPTPVAANDSPAAAPGGEKNDADLVAEFEKMLKP